jgi:hypothetical protein
VAGARQSRDRDRLPRGGAIPPDESRFGTAFPAIMRAARRKGRCPQRARPCVPLQGDALACRGRLRITLGPIASAGQTSSCVGDSVRIVRLTARFVAWSGDDACRDLVTWQIRVRALKRGTRTRTFLTGANACGDGCPRFGVGPARRLVLGTDGAVAWIAQDEAAGTPTYEVWRARASGAPRRLARGADIAPAYLKLEGDRAVWRQGGTTHSI